MVAFEGVPGETHLCRDDSVAVQTMENGLSGPGRMTKPRRWREQADGGRLGEVSDGPEPTWLVGLSIG